MVVQYRRNNVCKLKLNHDPLIVHAHCPKIVCPILYFVLWLMMKCSPYIWFSAVIFGCIIQFWVSNIFSILTSFSVKLLHFLPSYFYVYSWPIFFTCQLALVSGEKPVLSWPLAVWLVYVEAFIGAYSAWCLLKSLYICLSPNFGNFWLFSIQIFFWKFL